MKKNMWYKADVSNKSLDNNYNHTITTNTFLIFHQISTFYIFHQISTFHIFHQISTFYIFHQISALY
jgi:hypothetical protein